MTINLNKLTREVEQFVAIWQIHARKLDVIYVWDIVQGKDYISISICYCLFSLVAQILSHCESILNLIFNKVTI